MLRAVVCSVAAAIFAVSCATGSSERHEHEAGAADGVVGGGDGEVILLTSDIIPTQCRAAANRSWEASVIGLVHGGRHTTGGMGRQSELALEALADNAEIMGANAVVGVRLAIGGGEYDNAAIAYGTAVKVKAAGPPWCVYQGPN